MNWSAPDDLRSQLARLWERGDLLREALAPNGRFPLRLALRVPSSDDITGRFDAVRQWAATLAACASVRLEWRVVRHRVQGEQRLPAAVWVDALDEALSWLGKERERERFVALTERTRQELPALLPWLDKRPLQALALAAEWPRLLAVVAWVRAHPRPGVYPRQVDAPGVHSKFIEAHRGVLAELLDLVLPAEAIDPAATGAARFCARYGFLDKPVRIRLRGLDPGLPLVPGAPCPDLTLDADSFARLAVPARRVLITENETNFLALPPLPETLAIFGAGYGWEALARARWLERCAVHYWGDIDTHGFGILDQLRCHVPHAASLLMDRATLDAHQASWGREDQPRRDDLQRLTPDEFRLYDELRADRIRPALRLEQEHLHYAWVRARLEGM